MDMGLDAFYMPSLHAFLHALSYWKLPITDNGSLLCIRMDGSTHILIIGITYDSYWYSLYYYLQKKIHESNKKINLRQPTSEFTVIHIHTLWFNREVND